MHGCLDELQQLTELLELDPLDRVILIGDLINRGPDPAGVVRFAFERRFEAVLGNHEYHYSLTWRANKKYSALRHALGYEMHNWVIHLPAFIETESFLAVHAGLAPGVEVSATPLEILTNIRTWDGMGRDLRNANNPPWYTLYHGKKPVIYGHWAKEGLNVRKHTVGLDSGCVYGNYLTAYILESRSIVQVRSKRIYERPGGV